MLVKILKHGSGKSRGGTSAKNYLLGKDNDRVNARLLKGDPDITTEVINGLKFAKTYTSGGIHFAYDEAKDLTEQDKYDMIESFEKAMFPNLEPSQVSGYWVEHTDKVNEKGERRLELNFIYASVDLESGKALPVYYDANDRHLTSAWRDYTNIKYDLIDPLEVQRQQTIKIANNLPKHKKEILQDIHEIVTTKVVNGDIKNRADIVETLENIDGIELLGKPLKNKYIKIKDPDGKGKNIRLRGAIYDDPKWTITEFIEQLETAKTTDNRPKHERLEQAEIGLRESVKKRASRFEKRFSAVAERSAERAERLEERDINRADRNNRSYDEPSSINRTESEAVRAERKQAYSSDRRENRHLYKRRTATLEVNEHKAHATSDNTVRTSSPSNNSIVSNSATGINSNAHNPLPHRKVENILSFDISFDRNIGNGVSDNARNKSQSSTGKLTDEQDTRADNFRQSARHTSTGTATGTRATDELQDSRTTAFAELTEQLERTSKVISRFAEQIQPNPFKRPISKRTRENDADRREDDEYQYSNDADRHQERENSKRIESAFRQINKSTERAILLDERITRAKQEIEQRKIEAEKPKPQPEPTPPPSRGFRP